VILQQPEKEVIELVLAVCGMEIEDFQMPVVVVDPIDEREVADDGDLKFPTGGCNGAAKGVPDF
jgi:hypothetical protein